MARPPAKKLLVEGRDDKWAIIELMSEHVAWGDTREEAPVDVEEFGGVDSLLDPDVIPLTLRRQGLKTLGIVVDANDEFDSRWTRVRDRCKVAFPDIPKELPEDGLILSNAEGMRLGVWIMPDNRSRGMLETFLSFLIPDESDSLWRYAQHAAGTARTKGAGFGKNHLDKAKIHTWLAWQQEPGKPFGTALKAKFLDPRSPQDAGFVSWFKQLYLLNDFAAY